LRIVPVLLFLLAAAAHAERQKVAVLEFEIGKGLEIDRTYFSDKVRGSVQDRAPHLFVMTRESTEVLLKQFGRTLADCTGECAVETGRKLGADFVVSGRITKVGTRLALTMRLHATASGELLRTASRVSRRYRRRSPTRSSR
jgi:TolB-like protein